MKIRVTLGASILLLVSVQVNAAAYNSNQLNFVAPTQSLWGSNGSVGEFGISGSELGIDYDIGASSGTVSAQFQGQLSADYEAYLSTPGATSLSLSFQGIGTGQLNSELGAWADIEFLGVDVIDWGAALSINESFTPQLGKTVTGDDAITFSNVGLNLGVAKIGASIGIEQENSFVATSVDGLLAYSLRGSSITNYASINSLTDSDKTFDLLLSDAGIWDFWLEELILDNSFETSFDTMLFAYEEHVDGIEWTKKCVGRSWWKTCWWVPETTFYRNEIPLASLALYDGPPIQLGFNEVTERNGFSIEVGAIPIPPAFVLFGTFLLGLIGFSKRKAAMLKAA